MKKHFPLWKPQFRTEERFGRTDYTGYKSLRNSSSSFIGREDVRKIILEKSDHLCVYCGDSDNIQIDHIISVYQAYRNKNLIGILNTFQNLQALCRKCNTSKPPEGI